MCFFLVESAIVFRASGKDAERYLNSRLSNDVKVLKTNSACFAAALSAQGKTQGYFLVFRETSDQFILVCDSDNSGSVLQAFRQFIVADRVQIEELTQTWGVLHLLPPALQALSVAEPSTELSTCRVSDLIGISRLRSLDLGVDCIGPKQRLLDFGDELKRARLNPLSAIEQKKLRIEAGIPAFPDDLNEGHLFLEAGLEKAISFTKGCYVGQEVNERLDAQGRRPRILVSVVIDGNLNAQDSRDIDVVDTQEKKVGELTSHIFDEMSKKTLGIASLRNTPDLESQDLFVQGHAVHFSKTARSSGVKSS